MKGMEKKLFPIRLFNVKKLEDKINEGQEQIAFFQEFFNSFLLNLFSSQLVADRKTNLYKD